MDTILFDASIHLGQFSLANETIRLACKVSQSSLGEKSKTGIKGFISFNENSLVDDMIWNLDRSAQDVFYQFMDVFHSVKNIDRIAIDYRHMEIALGISKQLKLEPSSALSCAIAINLKIPFIHTLYSDLLNENVINYMKSEHNIHVIVPSGNEEANYQEDQLENYYREVINHFKKDNIDLFEQLKIKTSIKE